MTNKKKKYYDMSNLLACDAHYSIMIGEKSTGKSYCPLVYAFDRYIKSEGVEKLGEGSMAYFCEKLFYLRYEDEWENEPKYAKLFLPDSLLLTESLSAF